MTDGTDDKPNTIKPATEAARRLRAVLGDDDAMVSDDDLGPVLDEFDRLQGENEYMRHRWTVDMAALICECPPMPREAELWQQENFSDFIWADAENRVQFILGMRTAREFWTDD